MPVMGRPCRRMFASPRASSSDDEGRGVWYAADCCTEIRQRRLKWESIGSGPRVLRCVECQNWVPWLVLGVTRLFHRWVVNRVTTVPDLSKLLESDPRAAGAWTEWLQALTSEPDAALAAAEVYARLTETERDLWLQTLERDVALLGVPPVAVFAPLLAVEANAARRTLIARVLAGGRDVAPCTPMRALVGDQGRERVAVLVSPLYLDFVQVVACRYQVGERFIWVKQDPIVRTAQAPLSGVSVDGVRLSDVPVSLVVDDLASTVVALQRKGERLPDELRWRSDWFSPTRTV